MSVVNELDVIKKKNYFQQPIIHFPTKFETIITLIPHEKYHISFMHEPHSMCTKERKNKAQHQEGAINPLAKWKTIPRQDKNK